jgi:hypothetical protein
MTGLPAAADTVRNSEWWMGSLGVRNAWPVSRGSGVTVAVLSDGVDAQQPDVTGPRLTVGPDFTGTGQSSGPYYGEIGTGIAALIGGHGYGLLGESGVIGEVPLAQILSIRVTLPPNDPMLAQPAVAARLPGAIAQGIRYAVSHGASVIDLPLDPGQAGINGQGGASAAAGGSTTEAAAVKYALSRDVVLVAPAGDDNLASDSPNFPADYPGVIAVGAFNRAFAKAQWSSHQGYVTVTAAGSGLLLPTNSGTFSSQSGTAYASAVVAGIVAMMRGRFPGITVAQVRAALIAGAMFRHAGGLADGSGYGAVNAQRALTAAQAELTSSSSLAGAGTQPLVSQASPQPTSAGNRMVSSIIRDAVIAGALLLILLLLIGLYAAAGRRRAARQREAVAADWSRHAQRRNSRAGGTDADRLLEFFAAPVGGQAVARPGAMAPSPTRNGAYPAAGLPTAISRDPFATTTAPPPGATRDAADGRSSLGPASRAVTKRPSVSGAPPWEEASRPEGELPWAAAPASTAPPIAPAAQAGPVPGSAAGTTGVGVSDRSLAMFRRAAAADADSPTPSFPNSPAGPVQSAAARLTAPPPAGPGRPLSPTGSGQWDGGTGPRPTDTYRPASAPANLSQPDFSRPGLSQPDFSRPSFSPPDLSGPDLSGPDLSGPGLSGPGLSQPDFSRPSFSPPDLSGPDLSQPNFSRPDFSRPDFSQPGAGQAEPAGYQRAEPPAQGAGSGRPGQGLTGRLDWGRQPAPPPQVPDGQLQAPGGPLPVRQPRSSAPGPAMSPSGSLWERPADPADAPAESGEAGSRPIFVWNPGGTDSADGKPAELAGDAPKWRLRHRQEHPPGS